jgi:GAF domain-containing protein/DNA-binding NarL/FixJ family response regulator
MAKSVLIVDDDGLFRQAIGDGLRGAGYRVAVAADGLEALEQVRKAPPDFIILDLIMPKLDGVRVCKLLKRHPRYRAIPIIVLTGLGREGLKGLGDLGAEAAVVKRQMGTTFTEIQKMLNLLGSARLRARRPLESAQDLAERRIVTELLAERQHTQALLGSLGEGVVELDDLDRVAYANPTALRLLEHAEHDLLGSPGPDLFGPANAPPLQRGLRAVREGEKGHTVRLDLLYQHKTIGITLTALPLPDGPTGALFVLRDMTDLTRRARGLQALSAVNQRVLGALDLGAVLRETVAGTADLLGAERCAVFQAERRDDQMRLRCVQCVGPSDRPAGDLEIEPGEAVAGKAIAEARTVYARDLLRHPDIRLSTAARSRIQAEGVGAVLAAPILLPAGPFGALTIYRPRGHRFTPEEVELVASLAGSAAIAIENAGLYEKSQRRAQAAAALAEVWQVLSASGDPDRALDEIVHQVRRLMGVPFVGMLTLDKDQKTLGYVKGEGLSPERMAHLRLGVGAGIAGLAVKQKVPVQSANLLRDPRYISSGIEREGFRSLLCVPLLVGDQALGALAVFRQDEGPFSASEIEPLVEFAGKAALVLVNPRLSTQAGRPPHTAEGT